MPEFPPETVECRNFPRKNRFSCRNFPRKQSTLCKSLCPPVDRRGPLRRATSPRLPAKSSESRFRLGAVGGPTRPRPLASEKFAGARSPSQRRPATPRGQRTGLAQAARTRSVSVFKIPLSAPNGPACASRAAAEPARKVSITARVAGGPAPARTAIH